MGLKLKIRTRKGVKMALRYPKYPKYPKYPPKGVLMRMCEPAAGAPAA